MPAILAAGKTQLGFFSCVGLWIKRVAGWSNDVMVTCFIDTTRLCRSNPAG